MNKKDLRFKKTEKIIIQSFTDCVNKVGFEKTTIAMICENGDISRNTFYFHYVDKYDLLAKLFDELEQKMEVTLTDETVKDLKEQSVRDSVVWTYRTIEANRDMITLLMKCSREKMKRVFTKVFIELPNTKLFDDYYEISKDIEMQLIKNYLADAMVGYMETWLFNYDKIQTERIIDIMERLCKVPVETYFNQLMANKKKRTV